MQMDILPLYAENELSKNKPIRSDEFDCPIGTSNLNMKIGIKTIIIFNIILRKFFSFCNNNGQNSNSANNFIDIAIAKAKMNIFFRPDK